MSSSNKKLMLMKRFSSILKTKSFFCFISTTQFTIQDKALFKKEFEKLGIEVIVLKNRLFTKIIADHFPKYKNIIPLVQGLCLFVYSTNDENIELTTLQHLSHYIKKKDEFSFLGGLFNNKLINSSFIEYVLTLKDEKTIYSNLLSIIASQNATLINQLQTPANLILRILKKDNS